MKPAILIEDLFKLRQRKHTNDNYGSSWEGREVLILIGPWTSIRHDHGQEHTGSKNTWLICMDRAGQ